MLKTKSIQRAVSNSITAHFVAALLALHAVIKIPAATLSVTSIADSGPGTLRAALLASNDGDTISFSVTGKITLTAGELLVSKNVNILGPGPDNLAVDGNRTNRVFHVGSNAVVMISGLTIIRGQTDVPPGTGGGGGIFNDHATLTISNCVVSANSSRGFGAGVFSTGREGKAHLAIIHSSISGNAGTGIYSEYGTLSLESCLLLTNSAGAYGGGIYNDNTTLDINRTTLSGNTAGSSGGGMIIINSTANVRNTTLSGNFAGFSGGGFSSTFGATVNLANCTFSANSARFGSAIRNLDSSTMLRILNSTLSGNLSTSEGAISTSASIEIGSTIIDTGGSIRGFAGDGPVTSLGYNLSSDDGGGHLINETDRTNTPALLGPLQDNGGPTFTHALLCGSPAIDGGTNFSAVADDQRGNGFLRTYDHPFFGNAVGGDGTDIGAFEGQGVCNGRFIAISRELNGWIQLLFLGEPGRVYVIEGSLDPRFINRDIIGAAVAQADGMFLVEDRGAANYSHRFYRARLQ